ncbi:MAG: dihydroneopterin triphosphate diphosphatase [Burkholderiaceae bacterium]|nr:dihydroneopterin triphosphate diphosphatase [Burkholderiaceae bacterium]
MKLPESVLVVVHTSALDVLILERTDHPGYWQSITGSRDAIDEPLLTTCARELEEETGFTAAPQQFDDWKLSHRFEIYAHWRHRYAAGVTHNVEHVFGLCLPHRFEPRLDPREHLQFCWLNWRAAADACFSWTNVEAIQRLGRPRADRAI